MEKDMEYVYAIYQEGSVSKAAEKLFITQPALSMALRRVEAKFGEALFDRSQTPFSLTHAGKIYIQKCKEILLLNQEMSRQIHDLHNLQKGALTIGGTHFILSYVLAPALSIFSERYPNITLKIIECRSDASEHLLLDGTIDMYLRCSACPASIWRIAPAFTDHVLVAVPKPYVKQYKLPDNGLSFSMVQADKHLSSDYKSTDFQKLSHIPFLQLSDGNNLGGRLRDLFAAHKQTPNIKMVVEQLTTSYYLADSGIGATLASTMMIKKSMSENLIFYKVDSPLLIRQFYFVGRKRGYISKASHALIETLQAYYGS